MKLSPLSTLVVLLLFSIACSAAEALPPALFQDRDCRDFKTQAEAQAFYVTEGGPAEDPHMLDDDRDGRACEGLETDLSKVNPFVRPFAEQRIEGKSVEQRLDILERKVRALEMGLDHLGQEMRYGGR